MAEFAAAVGLPTETGKAYLGEALELRHRLPRTWARVVAGDLPAWRARRIARQTIGLSVRRRRGSWTTRSPRSRTGSGPAGWTGWSRRRSSGSCRPRPGVAGRPPTTPGTPTCTPARCPSRAPCGSRPRSTSPTPWTSTPPSPPAPRSWPTSAPPRPWTCAAPKTLGEMARHQLALDLDTETDTPPLRPGRAGGAARAPLRGRDHGPDSAPDSRLHLARVANTRSFVDADQVRAWCGRPGAMVTVKPVVDLSRALHVEQYQVPDRLAAQATERDLTCVFPWCTRPAEACDLDHAIPYSEGGPTASDNLGSAVPAAPPAQDPPPGWGYTVLEPGSYLWSLTARLPVPARPPRHHRRHPRPGHPPARPVATPPHTPRQPTRRGATGMFQAGCNAARRPALDHS